MGCAQGRPASGSPLDSLETLKMENGYVKGGYVAARRSTGQRHYTSNNVGQYVRQDTRLAGGNTASNGRTGVGSRENLEKTKITEGGVKVSLGVIDDEGGRHVRSGKSSSGSRGTQEKKSINEDRENSSGNRGDGNSAPRRTSAKTDGNDGELENGWPKWLTDNIPREALAGLTPRSAETYDKIDKVGQGTYSNVYKARDKYTGKIVALKKVRFDTSEPESVKFMAREIRILRRLDHPNVLKLEGLATSRMQYSLYLVFDYMQCDLASIITRPDARLTEPQVKCYMHQLLSGLQHCHERGILHRDIKGSNLLIDRKGMLQIADFGLANYHNPEKKRPLTNRVVTLWYRAPELLLGSTDYGAAIDLWSAGCLLAEMFIGRPILPGRTEVEQIHKIFKLCGTPSEDFWKKAKLGTTFRPPQSYKPRLREAFRHFPASCVGLLSTLLAMDPTNRGSAASALQHEFFYTHPLPCDLSGLPVISKAEDEAVPIPKAERRKHRSSKMRHRSQSHIIHRNIDVDAAKLERDPGGPEEELKTPKSAETMILSQGPGSSTSTSSNGKQVVISTLTEATTERENKDSPPFKMGSPDLVNRQNSSRTESHPKANKNIKNRPPLPEDSKRSSSRPGRPHNSNTNDKINKLNDQVKRSVSSREYRHVERNKLLELHTVD
ncbi:OLC1v1017641C1 [Oldenlandia corymbosa var. corymbosa]|uniref:OLC1v1017641C1 n=1 Tax=Oldenlandia corymbosa var. corymbosa TaxID=529605 RepID=A0AAV1E9X3_OLDCO|nr:OLC1v1017641C1 [Oldenlandia corymbosa var. corymbosa]